MEKRMDGETMQSANFSPKRTVEKKYLTLRKQLMRVRCIRIMIHM